MPKRPPATPKETKRYLRDLIKSVESVLEHLDAEMKKPSDNQRGQRIAKICNFLELQKDLAKRFGL